MKSSRNRFKKELRLQITAVKTHNTPIMKSILFHLVLAIGCLFAPSRGVSAGSGAPPIFRDSFQLSLGTYWCEQGRMSVADMDGDGRKDIVMMQTSLASTVGPPWSYKARVVMLRGQADGGFVSSTVAEFPGAYGYNIATGDLNNDGALDLVVRASQVTHVYFNDREGGFRKVGTAASGYYIGPLMDVNRDGRLDIVSGLQTGQGGAVMATVNSAAGVFQTAWQSSLYGSGYDAVETVLRVNLNGDGIPDLAAREIYGGRLITFFGTTNAAEPFVEHRVTGLGDRTFALAAGRVNDDGLDDLAAHVGWGEVRVFVNNGGGQLSNSWTSPNLGQAAFNLSLADFDRDGLDDIFVGTFGDGGLRIYRNNGSNGFDEWWTSKGLGEGYNGRAADINSDGWPDLIVGEEHSLRVLLNRTGYPEITSVRPSPGRTVVEWRATPGKRYEVQFAGRWGEAWTGFAEDVIAANTTASFTDISSNHVPERFYRVVEKP